MEGVLDVDSVRVLLGVLGAISDWLAEPGDLVLYQAHQFTQSRYKK